MNHPLLIDFLKEIKVLEAKQGRSYRLKNLKICLQEHDFNGKAGRRDIAIEFDDTRVVIEAKIDGSIPTEDQVLKYTLTRDEDENDIDFNYINQVWGPFKKRYIITLTKRKVPPGRYKDIKNLIERSINPPVQIIHATWYDSLKAAKKHMSNEKDIINQFYEFMKRDYYMKYYEKEVLCRHIIRDEAAGLYRMALNEPKGYYFDGGHAGGYVYPEVLFFCPVYGPSKRNIRTGEFIRRIDDYSIMSATEILAEKGPMKDFFEKVHCQKWPDDKIIRAYMYSSLEKD